MAIWNGFMGNDGLTPYKRRLGEMAQLQSRDGLAKSSTSEVELTLIPCVHTEITICVGVVTNRTCWSYFDTRKQAKIGHYGGSTHVSSPALQTMMETGQWLK